MMICCQFCLNFAHKFNLRRYNWGFDDGASDDTDEAGEKQIKSPPSMSATDGAKTKRPCVLPAGTNRAKSVRGGARQAGVKLAGSSAQLAASGAEVQGVGAVKSNGVGESAPAAAAAAAAAGGATAGRAEAAGAAGAAAAAGTVASEAGADAAGVAARQFQQELHHNTRVEAKRLQAGAYTRRLFGST